MIASERTLFKPWDYKQKAVPGLISTDKKPGSESGLLLEPGEVFAVCQNSREWQGFWKEQDSDFYASSFLGKNWRDVLEQVPNPQPFINVIYVGDLQKVKEWMLFYTGSFTECLEAWGKHHFRVLRPEQIEELKKWFGK